MKKVYIFMWLCFAMCPIAFTPVQAQCWNNPPKNISTNPDNYQNVEDPAGNLKWDWRLQYWYGYRKGTPTPVYYQIQSPFYDVYNPNLYDLSSLTVKNYDPKNGWELLIKNFGTSTAPLDNPFFILYNKYTGLFRVFIQINSNYQNSSSAMIDVRFQNSSLTAGTLSQEGDKSFPLNSLKGNAKILVPNKYINGGQGSNNFFWLYADFNTLYDPCACKQTSVLLLESFLFSNWTVTLTTNGKAETIISNSLDVVNGVKNENNGFSLGQVESITKQAALFIDGTTKLINYAGNFVSVFAPLFPQKTSPDVTKEDILKTLTDATGNFSKSAATILGLPSFFSGIVNTILGTSQPTTTQFAHTDITLNTTGTLQQQTQFTSIPFKNPGTDNGNLTAELKPVYNNPIGVFNILELPKIQYAVYQPLSKKESYVPTGNWQGDLVDQTVTNCLNNKCRTTVAQGCTKCGTPQPMARPLQALPIYQYKITTPLQYVINPAANLKVISIKTSLVFQMGKNNYPTGTGQYSPTSSTILTYQITPSKDTVLADAFNFLNAKGFNTDYSINRIESEDRLNMLGFDLLSRRHENDLDSAFIASPTIPVTCIQNTSFLIANGFLGGPKKVSLRISLVFQPKTVVPGSTVQNVLQTYTFDYDDASITEVSTTLPYTDNISYTYALNKGFYTGISALRAIPLVASDMPAYVFSKGFMQIPTQIKLKKGSNSCITIGSDLNSFGDIIFDGAICTPTQSRKLYAAGNIQLLNGAVLPTTNVTVIKSINDPCSSIVPAETSPTTFCNSTTYTQLTQAFREAEPSFKKPIADSEQSVQNVIISPNPAKDNFIVSLKLLKRSSIRIDVFNSLSQAQPATSLTGSVTFEPGNYSFKLDASQLISGVYFVKINSNNQVVTKKLIIQK